MCKLPALKKCCLCLPLRNGLIIFSGFQLVVNLIMVKIMMKDVELFYGRGLPIDAPICYCVVAIIDACFAGTIMSYCKKKYSDRLAPVLPYLKIWWIICVMVTVFVACRLPFMYQKMTKPGERKLFFTFGIDAALTITFAVCFRPYMILLVKGLVVQNREEERNSETQQENVQNGEKKECIEVQINGDKVQIGNEKTNGDRV